MKEFQKSNLKLTHLVRFGYRKIACSVLPDSMLDVAGNSLYELQAANDAVFEMRRVG